MRTILHILTRPADEVAQAVIDAQRTLPDTKVEVKTLGAEADYNALLNDVFRADSVEVW